MKTKYLGYVIVLALLVLVFYMYNRQKYMYVELETKDEMIISMGKKIDSLEINISELKKELQMNIQLLNANQAKQEEMLLKYESR